MVGSGGYADGILVGSYGDLYGILGGSYGDSNEILVRSHGDSYHYDISWQTKPSFFFKNLPCGNSK